MRRLLIAITIGIVLAGCGSTKIVTTTSTTATNVFHTTTATTTTTRVRIKRGPPLTTTETTTHTLTASSPAFAPSSHGQSFSGESTENIGTIHVHHDSELYWSCASCSGDNFTIDNNGGDDSTIEINALGPTSGKTFVDAGDYHDVTVETEGGAWTLAVNPG